MVTSVHTGPCAKQTVLATIVAKDGRWFTASNHCRNPQQVCPRGNLPTGQGYELCKNVCDQSGHAEINVIELAGEAAFGGILYVQGHTYACENCLAAAHKAGITQVVIGEPPYRLSGKSN